jgi:nitrate reductase gamma subunit
MTETEFLLWVRGPAFEIASVIFVIGVVVRLLEIVLLGRKPDLSEARGSAVMGGLRTIVTRSTKHNFQQSTFTMYTMVAGYIFHIGFFVTLLLYAPHILVIDEVFGVSWPALPTPVVDAVTIVTIVALLAILVHRLRHPVLRFLSRFQDYLVWFVTILPLVTGYIAFHRIGFSPPLLIAIHILIVELLMVVFPFTKLIHAFTLFMARYYNGAIAGRRGVES